MGLKGEQAFGQYYSQIFGSEWPGLCECLMSPAKKISLDLGGKRIYELDPASKWVAEQLGVRTGERVLDMCAAPGGKSLCLLMVTDEIHLMANDMSVRRVERLKRVFYEHLPEKLHVKVQVVRGDGNRFGLKEPGAYDKILLDAPCSGERHILRSPKDLKNWSLGRLKGLARRQYSLLCSGLLALKPGGRLLYSTCSLSPLENDGPIDRLIKKKHGSFKVIPLEGSKALGDPTTYGRQFRPDKHQGWGPMYACLLEKC